MCTPGRAESVWHLGTVLGFPLCRFWGSVAWNGPPSPSLPPALGRYSGQAVANALLAAVSPRRLRGRRTSSRTEVVGVEEDRKAGQIGRQGEFRIFVLAHVPEPSFPVLIYCGMLAFPTEVKERIVRGHLAYLKKKKKKCCPRLC